jgi:hypothetical protein
MSPYKYYRRMFFVYEKYGTGKAQYWKPCFKKKTIIITYNNLASKQHFERFIKREFSNWRYGEFLFKNNVGEIYGRITIRDNANIVELHKLGTNGRIYPLYKKLFMKLTTKEGQLNKLMRDIVKIRTTGKLSTSKGPHTKKDQSPG